MACNLLIDGRMFCASGIGRVIRGVLPVIASDGLWKKIIIYVNSADMPESQSFLRCLPESNCTVDCRINDRSIYSPFIGLSDGFIGLSEADAIWFPHYPHPLFARIRCPYTITIPDCCHIAPHEARLSIPKRLLAQAFLRHAGKAPSVLFYGHAAEQEYRSLVGLPKGKVFLMPCGVDDWWRTTSALERLEGSNRPYVVYLGNLKPHKNLSRLINAMGQLWSDGIVCDLHLIGKRDGFLSGTVPLPGDAIQDGRIVLRGFLSDEETKSALMHSCGLVFPSLYEGFGLPPLEAMAAGVPVACSHIAPVKEVCGDAVDYFDPLSVPDIANSVRRLINLDPASRAAIADKGRKRASEFTWQRCAQGVQAALLHAMENWKQ